VVGALAGLAIYAIAQCCSESLLTSACKSKHLSVGSGPLTPDHEAGVRYAAEEKLAAKVPLSADGLRHRRFIRAQRGRHQVSVRQLAARSGSATRT